MLRLHDVYASPFSRRAWIALEEKKLPYERVVHAYEACDAPDFPHPFHVTPVLEAEGRALFESLAIVEWIDETSSAEPRLVPEDRFLRARARAFAQACEMNFQRHFREVIWWLREGRAASSLEEVRGSLAGIEEALPPLERELAGRDWLVGPFSIADVSWGPFLARSADIGLGPIFERHPAVAAWIERLLARPSFRATRVELPFAVPVGWLAEVEAARPR